MSISKSESLNNELFNLYGFKRPSDVNKAEIITELLKRVHGEPPTYINFAYLNPIKNYRNNFSYEASMFFTADATQLILTFHGTLTIEDHTSTLTINKIKQPSIHLYSMGSLTTPIELFSDAQYTQEEIECSAMAIFNQHTEHFKLSVLNKVGQYVFPAETVAT